MAQAQAPVRLVGGLGATVPVFFEMVDGVAKPKDLPTLGLFQGLQRAVAAAGTVAVTPDGDLGPATLTATKRVVEPLLRNKPDPVVAQALLSTQALAAGADIVSKLIGAAFAIAIDTTPIPATAIAETDLPQPLAPPSSPRKRWLLLAGVGAVVALGTFFVIRSRRRSTFTGAEDFDYEPASDDFIDV